ncbi:MAG: hypothetical protein WA354_03800 [Terracidiphilus sp.]
MKEYFSSWLFTAGFIVLLVGSAPLLTIIVLAKIGIWPDPDPNPIGPGLLTFVTFWPGVLLMVIGARRVSAHRRKIGG